MPGPVDDPLIQGLAEGRGDAFAALYDQFGRSLFRVAFAMLGSRHDAEDAVQDVFVGLVRARGSLGNVENLRAYLFASLRRAASKLAMARKSERSLSPLELINVPESPEPEMERSDLLEQALRSLPAEQREVVTLKVDGGLTFAELASVLGVSANTAASRYRYALEKLRAILREQSHGV